MHILSGSAPRFISPSGRRVGETDRDSCVSMYNVCVCVFECVCVPLYVSSFANFPPSPLHQTFCCGQTIQTQSAPAGLRVVVGGCR